jgi:hypothetical protein
MGIKDPSRTCLLALTTLSCFCITVRLWRCTLVFCIGFVSQRTSRGPRMRAMEPRRNPRFALYLFIGRMLIHVSSARKREGRRRDKGCIFQNRDLVMGRSRSSNPLCCFEDLKNQVWPSLGVHTGETCVYRHSHSTSIHNHRIRSSYER